MACVSDVLAAIDRIAPFVMAFEGDRVGLQIGALDAPVSVGVVTLDCSMDAIAYAESVEAQVIVSHHPVIWEPLKSLGEGDYASARAFRLARSGIAHIAAHTNWDAAPGGLNDGLAELLGLTDVRSFGKSAEPLRVKLVTFVPEDAVERVVDALAGAGAGRIGRYERCWFGTKGVGSFVPAPGAEPAIGEVGRRESVPETKVEMVLPRESVEQALVALRETHPYEEPAFDLVTLESVSIQPIGRLGRLARRQRLADFAQSVSQTLSTACRTWGEGSHTLGTVAVVGGAGDDHWRLAQDAGAEALVTGEVRHHVALEASEHGMALIEAGHFGTENPGCARLLDRLANEASDVAWRLYAPKPGHAGRPLEQRW